MIKRTTPLLALTSTIAFSQEPGNIDLHVLACTGSADASLQAYRIEWTIGELASSEGGNSYYHLTNGFHQPLLTGGSVGIDESMPRPLQALLAPNPAIDELTVSLCDPTHSPLAVVVRDALGRVVLSAEIAKGTLLTTIPVGALAQGSYLLALMNAVGQARFMGRFIKMSR